MFPGMKARFIHTDRMTLAYWEIDAGANLPEHSHAAEQVANILRGEYELTVDGVTRLLTPGITAVIPSGVRHSGRAITDCEILDIFQPVREEYR
jgi:quercetin dioxygenase-like cupin family protein